jgi:hypothetical protein
MQNFFFIGEKEPANNLLRQLGENAVDRRERVKRVRAAYTHHTEHRIRSDRWSEFAPIVGANSCRSLERIRVDRRRIALAQIGRRSIQESGARIVGQRPRHAHSIWNLKAFDRGFGRESCRFPPPKDSLESR